MLSVHEPSLNSRDLEFVGKGSLFKSVNNYDCYWPKTEQVFSVWYFYRNSQIGIAIHTEN